jgi:hypothetical protein
MSASSKRYGFFDLHPGVCLAPFGAAVAFLAYESLATLATARASVGGPWLVSAFVGVLCGLATLAVFVARARAGKPLLVMIGPVIVIVIGLLISKQELPLIAVHAGLVTTAFQAGTLAFTGVMAAGLVAGLCWVYARLLSPAGAENRKAARIPSTSLHISRTEDWEAAADHPIDQGTWEVFAGDHPTLSRYDFDSDRAREDNITWIMRNQGVTRERAAQLGDRRAAQVEAVKVSEQKMAAARPDLLAKHPQQRRHFSGGPGLPTFALERPDGTRLLLQWRQGQVTVLRVSPDVAADAALIAPLARELDAHVCAEDGTRYA